MADQDFFSRLIELRDDMRVALDRSDGSDRPRDAATEARLAELEQLIADWGSPRPPA